jgi:hypothetical protein
MRKINNVIVSLGLACVLVLCAGQISLQAQSLEGNVDWLTPAALQEMNVHLPSYMASVQAQMAYQAKVPLHQEITVGWSAGAETPGFVLVKRWQHMQKSASAHAIKGRPLLVIAATPGGEVRAFALCADPRANSSQVELQLPQDGQISRLIFVSMAEGSGFERIGEVQVGTPEGTPVPVTSGKTISREVLPKQ